ncbi:CPBP family intramembrane metalloprotease [Paenibacillus sp. HN-1]|uniref:CPBP family intramembrane glutamic endopeptidase n=1 Tax=Paenibacillus sp. CGMCC 1.18879 TaxID=2834466 RepID=UPI001CA86370|nr:CPBP family intramembrane glutamic endopeptidase [Paenibacillus sp. CGMCC 1.18879]MBY9078762.1 CPBP family intramembrane metalloprotease [Paenibacillus sp. CGMCC 1.18879]MBY9088078.1 CPBP family intramembrane metalloprotease [Paenibacillus sinensis]
MVKAKGVIIKVTWVIILLIILYSVQHLVNFLSYDYRGPSSSLVKVFSVIGIEGNIARFILWDLFQVAITIIGCKLLIKKTLKELGFNLHNLKSGVRYICTFLLIFPLIQAIAWFIIYKWMGMDALTGGVSNESIVYAIQDILVYGLLPGVGEEPLFRVFVIQFLLLTAFKEQDLSDRSTMVWVVLISAICFSYGHIYIVSWSPFTVTYSAIQLLTAFVLGIFYAVTYIRTKSILTAVVCHNYSDFINRLGNYILFYLLLA